MSHTPSVFSLPITGRRIAKNAQNTVKDLTLELILIFVNFNDILRDFPPTRTARHVRALLTDKTDCELAEDVLGNI